MAMDDPKSGKPHTIRISGETTAGFIVGRDICPPVSALGASAAPTPAALEPLRTLFLGVNREATQALRVSQEAHDLELALRQATPPVQFYIRDQQAGRLVDLQSSLLRHRPQIVHFSGHGNADGIRLEDETGQVVQGPVLARILGVFKKQIRCVVLSACYSQDQAQAIAEDIDCVVGIPSSLGDRAASCFSTAFYHALAFGGSLAEAFYLACAQIDLSRLRQEETPKLIALRQDPWEIVFARREEATSSHLNALSGKFEGLLKRMQTPAVRKGMEAAFNANPEALGRAAARAARRRR